MRIALTGNPNSGKTTMYNALTQAQRGTESTFPYGISHLRVSAY
mgnify:CR=1 FL=1